MGQAKRRDKAVADYLASVSGLSCPGCGAIGLEVVDLYTELPMFHEPGMPCQDEKGPLPRYLCGQCYIEWD